MGTDGRISSRAIFPIREGQMDIQAFTSSAAAESFPSPEPALLSSTCPF